ncbi:MAG: hypothetical protein IJM37_04180 [Lachnospiraceae bacterium]|nr:hypothetical protein [Lachnospiraceae bacterium]
MKKIFRLICLLMIFAAFCGCSKNINNSEATDVINELTKEYEKKTVVDFGDTVYNFKTDSQNCFDPQMREIVSVNSGYYFFIHDKKANCWLKYYDKNSNTCIPVCQRVDCNHDNDNCDSVFLKEENITNADGRLWYYKDMLYYISTEIHDNCIDYNLNSITLDGSKRTKICTLYSSFFYDSKAMGMQMLVHRGEVYYSMSGTEISYLYKRSLSDIDSEIEICRCSGFYTGIYNMQGYGDGICFQCYYYEDEPKDEYDIKEKVFYYNSNTEEISFLSDDILGLYSLADYGILYSNGTDMMYLGFDNYESKVFIKDCVSTSSFDGKYIYVDNIDEIEIDIADKQKRAINIYDIAGNLVDSITLENNSLPSAFGDEDYLFQYFLDEYDDYVLCSFDKSQIGTGKHEWNKIK